MSKGFNQGYACALSCIIQTMGYNTQELEALEANGMTSIYKLKKMGVDPYDIKILTPAVKEIMRKNKRRRGT